MNAETKLSGMQLFWLLAMFTIGLSVFLTIAPAVQRAHNDVWISLTVNLFATTLLTWISVHTALRYPGQTMVQYAQSLLGTWPGRVISVLYLLYWTSLSGIIVRETADFMMTSEFHHTPPWVFIISMVAIVLYLLRDGGPTSIGRISLLIGPMVMATLLLTLWLSVPDGRWSRLLPLYALNGPGPILHGAMPVLAFTGNSVIVGMLVPFVKHTRHSAYMAVAGVAAAGLFLIGAGVQTIAVFGPDLPAAMWNPFFDLTRFISVSNYLEEIEPFVVVFWFLSAFVRLSVLTFATSYGWSQLFNSSRVWPFLWAVSAIAAVEAFLPRNIVDSSRLYSRAIAQDWAGPILFAAVPLLLWVVSGIRSRRRKGPH